MYRRNNAGGRNKSHRTVERVPRIDSYEAATNESCDVLFTHTGAGPPLMLNSLRYMECQGDAHHNVVKVWDSKGPWNQTLELSSKENGFGGAQTFFLCPSCGARRRYLYLTERGFLCRECAHLNYRSQQEPRSDSMYNYRKGMDFVEKHLNAWPRARPDGFSFCDWVPDRPRYMHQVTYRRYLGRFLRYRKKHADRQVADMLRLIGFVLGPGALQEIDRLQYCGPGR